MPEIELVNLATRTEDSAVSSEAYDAFMADATAGITYDMMSIEEAGISINASPTDPTILPEKRFYNVPLLYTTYRIFTFEKGTEVMVTTDSKTAHNLEVIYYGTQFGHNQSPPPLSGEEDFPIGPTHELLPEISVFAKANFNEPSSEDMQTLTWFGPYKEDDSDKAKASVTFTATKYGMYFVRVRSRDNGVVGTASLRVTTRIPEDEDEDKNEYVYESVPISSSIVDCDIPDDGNKYASLAKGKNSGKDDPIIFIHNRQGKLIGIDDDSSTSQQETYQLSSWMDSFIAQTYMERVEHISISSYSSRNPTSTCDIRARILVGDKNTARGKRGASNGVGSLIGKESVVIPATINRDLPLTVTAPSQIRRLSAFNLLGRLTGSVVSNDESVDISISDLNITAPGIYILSIKTDRETVSRKVFIK